MMVALAGAWFLVFMPSSGKQSARKTDRVLITRRAGLVVALGAVFAAVVAFFAGQGLIVAIGFGAVLIGFGSVYGIRRIGARQASQQKQTRRRVATGLTADQAEPEPEIEYRNPRAWNAGEFPSQTLRPKYATIETPTLAEVIELTQPQELSSETLDEIMRRRRAN